MRKVNNLVAMSLLPSVDATIEYRNADPASPTLQELTVVAVGPCVVFVRPVTEKGQDEQSFLLGVVEGRETFQWAFPGKSYEVAFEPSGPVYYASPAGAVAVDVGEVKSFVRLEKPGLYTDELSFALHQQSVLTSIAAGRERLQRDAYTRDLERKLATLAERVERLMPPPEPEQQEAAE